MTNYIVLVKQVPDISRIDEDAFDPVTGTLQRSKLASQINELDAGALAFAHQMRRLMGEKGKVVAITMGPDSSVEVLRYCLARGADEAVHLCDSSMAGADTWATAKTLSLAIEKIVNEKLESSDDYYIVCGMQSVDGDTAQVPAQISSQLDVPIVPYATEPLIADGRLAFRIITSMGSETVCPRSRPALISVAKYDDPLFPVFSLARSAIKRNIAVWKACDIGACELGSIGSKTQVIKIFPPPPSSRECVRYDTPAEFADCIVKSIKCEDAGSENVSDVPKYILPKLRKSEFDRSYEADEKVRAKFKLLESVLESLNITRSDEIDGDIKTKISKAVEGQINEYELDVLIDSYSHRDGSYQGPIWVVGEITNGVIVESVFELLGEARILADQLQVELGVLLIGGNSSELSKCLLDYPVDRVYHIEHVKLKHFDPCIYTAAAAWAIKNYKPQIVLYSATPIGRVLAPRVAYALDCGLTADCTSFAIGDNSMKSRTAILYQTRPALGGNIMATIITKNSFCQMATVRPGVFPVCKKSERRYGSSLPEGAGISEHEVSSGIHDLNVQENQLVRMDMDFSNIDLSLDVISCEELGEYHNLQGDVVVSGGKGLRSRDDYNALLEMLCESIASVTDAATSVGASRAAVECGFAHRAAQVGQSGTTVKPKVYIAVGISGAIQHMIGVGRANRIFAINNDPAAPIFKKCDFYMVGKAQEIIPQLCEEISKMKADR